MEENILVKKVYKVKELERRNNGTWNEKAKKSLEVKGQKWEEVNRISGDRRK